jgi:EmrB/QacA subfamily drug resistance transporter
VLLSYLLTITTLMMSVGRLADIIGKKSLYTSGFIIFTIGSVLCGLAPGIGWLIAFRVVQGLGAVTIMALGPAIVTEAFPSYERGKALGIIGSVVSVGFALGPALGGVLLANLSWHWIFFVNLPIGIVGIFTVVRYVPDIQPAGGQRFDYAGAVMLFASLFALLLALTFGQRGGFAQPRVVLLLAGWLLFLSMFIIIELRSDQPIIDLRLFQNRSLAVNVTNGFLSFLLIAGMLVLLPYYLQIVLGYEETIVGLLLSSIPLALGMSAPLAGSLSDRFGTPIIAMIGLCILVVGYGLVSILDTHTTAIAYMLYCVPIGIGMGVFQSPNNSAIMGSVAREQLGVASGLLAVTRTLGQTAGVAVLGAVWASRATFHSGGTFQGEVAEAPPTILVAALHDTALFAVALISLALALSIWIVMQHQGEVRRRASAEQS